MAKLLLNERNLHRIVQGQLQAGEVLKNCAFGITMPPMWLQIIFAGTLLPCGFFAFTAFRNRQYGSALIVLILWLVIGVAMMVAFRKSYAVGLTDRRLLLLQFGVGLDLRSMRQFDLSNTPRVDINESVAKVVITFCDPSAPIELHFNDHAIFDRNGECARAIACSIAPNRHGSP